MYFNTDNDHSFDDENEDFHGDKSISIKSMYKQ